MSRSWENNLVAKIMFKNIFAWATLMKMQNHQQSSVIL